MSMKDRLKPQVGALTSETCQVRPLTTGEQIVAEARGWLGTKFFHSGREKGIGCDCSGLVLGCWHALSLTAWDFRRYAPGGDAERLQAGLQQFCERVEAPEAGDVLLLRLGRQPIHCGLFTGQGTLIHACQDTGRVVEVPLDEHWGKRIVSVWRWRGQDG
jgi:NlpC/P60 family putative phage cell wall peptidase